MDRDHPGQLSLTPRTGSTILTRAESLTSYGTLDPFAAKALSVLQKEPSIVLQLDLARPHTQSQDRAIPKRQSKRVSQPVLRVIIYGARRLFESVGTFVAECHYFLQQPYGCDRNVEYCNPHCLSPESEHHIFTYELKTSTEQENPHANRPYLDCNPIDAFTDTSQNTTLPETKTPLSLKTILYRYVEHVHILRPLPYIEEHQLNSLFQTPETGLDIHASP